MDTQEEIERNKIIESKFNLFMNDLLTELNINPNDELSYNIGIEYDTNKIIEDIKNLVNKIQDTDERGVY